MAWVSGTLVAQIYFDSPNAALNSARFDALNERRAAFEAALGEQAIWDEMADRKGARVTVRSGYDDLTDSDRWPEMIDWLIEKQVRLSVALDAAGGTQRLREAVAAP